MAPARPPAASRTRGVRRPARGWAAFVSSSRATLPSDYIGRSSSGILVGAFPDLNLRLAEWMTELRMPAALLPSVLAGATLALVDRAPTRYPDDLRAIAEQAARLSLDETEQYLALLTTDGPLVPVEAVSGGSGRAAMTRVLRLVASAALPGPVPAAAQAPAIEITSPRADVIVMGDTRLEAVLTAEVPVERVTFSVDGQTICSAEEPPYGCRWDAGAAAREHHVRVVAYLRDGRRVVGNLRTKDIGYTERVDVDAVQVPVIVTNGGKFVRGLQRADFSVLEDGVPQRIESLVSESMPLDLVLAIDISGSMANAIDEVKRAVKQLLSKLRPRDAATLIGFNETTFIVAERETDQRAREEATDLLTSWGGTALYDATVKALELVRPKAGRKGVVIFSDGDDQDSVVAPRDRDGGRAGERGHALHRGLRPGRQRARAPPRAGDVRAHERWPGVLRIRHEGARRGVRRDRAGAGEPVRPVVHARGDIQGRRLARTQGDRAWARTTCGRVKATGARHRPKESEAPMRPAPLSTAALLWLAASATSTLQQPHDLSPMPFRAAVEAVTIDVGVIDDEGKPVEDLGPRDFVVTVGGQTRRVVSAIFVAPDARRASSAAANPAGDIAIPVSTNDNVGVGRLVLFAVDQNTLDLTQARQVTDSATRLFDHLTPADRSALVVIPVGAGVPFTSEHDRVLKALQRSAGLATNGTESRALGLDEARAIASGDFAALRNVANRECASERGTDPTQGLPSSQGGAPAAGGQSGSGGTRGQQPGSAESYRGFEPTDSCTRQLQFEATSVWHQAHGTSIASMTSLRNVLAELKKVPGEKTLVLISGGWPLDVRETSSELAPLASAAADARVTVFTLFSANADNSADRRTVSAAPLADMAIRRWPLQTLAGMTGGGSYRVDAGAGAVFDRLGRELSGFYRISVEQDPRDVDGPARLLKVHVLRKGVTARAPERFLATSYADRDVPARLEAALISPLPATGLGMRMVSYVAAEPGANDRAKIVLVCEVFGMQPGEVTFQLALRDTQGKVVETAAQKVGSAVADQLPFTTSINVAPGRYAVRAAVMDAAGSVGSVDHVVEVKRTVIGGISAGDLTLGRVPARKDEPPGFLLDAIAREDRLALQLDLTGDPDRVSAADVLFELAASDDGPALASVEATRSSGSGQGLAQGVADLQLLPPGVYVARAKVSDGAGASAIVRRPFIVTDPSRRATAGDPSTASGVGTSTDVGVRIAFKPPPFTLDQVLAPAVLGIFLDRLAARPDAAGPSVAPVLERLRTAPARDLKVPEELAAESPVAAGFVTGVTRLARTELDPAAQAFRASLRASSDFFPAMIYLGACFAAAGKDPEAAGAWQTALIKEGDVPAVHHLLIDALLRLKRTDAAIAAVERAERRWPDDPAFTRQRVLAQVSAGRYADALATLDRLTAADPADEPVLALGLQIVYQAITQSHPIEGPDADRARLLRYAERYRQLNGRSMALVDAWVAAATRNR